MKSNNVIEINGKIYDAKSGRPIENHIKKNVAQPKSLDILSTKAKKTGIQHKIAVTSTPETKAQPKKVTEIGTTRRAHPEAPVARSKPKNSSTLHRKSVSRPQIQSVNTSVSAKKVESIAKKYADNSQKDRVLKIEKNQMVSRFGNHFKPETANKKIRLESAAKQTGTFLLNNQAARTGTETKERLIKQAVTKATAKPVLTKKVKKPKSKSFTKYASSFAVVLILTGYIAYLNIPSISMKVAANRAGFSASLPGYTPGGYSMKGPIAYTPGQVTINFKANTDERSFSLKQQPTTWDSVALLENFVTKKNPNYLTYQDRGLTIYIYDGSNAAWVNGGKLYSLEGTNSQLDTDQLLKLATSM